MTAKPAKKITPEEYLEYFQTSSDVIPADIEIRPYGTTSQFDSLESVEDILTIESVTPVSLQLSKVKRIYINEDGTITEEVYKDDQDLPERREEVNWSDLWYWLVIPAVVLLVIVVVVVVLVTRKPKNPQ